jgi:Mg-chelatase subunit ChlD
VRESVATPVGETAVQPAPLKLSSERREKLLAHFKTIAPKEFAKPPRRKISWLVPLAAAAAIALLAAISVPNFVKARTTSYQNAIINNLRLLDSSKQQWALEQRKSSTDVPTSENLRPYFERGFGGELPGGPDETYFLGAVGQPPVAKVKGKWGKETIITLPGAENYYAALNKPVPASASPAPAPSVSSAPTVVISLPATSAEQSSTAQAVPLLGDIPLAGQLYKKTPAPPQAAPVPSAGTPIVVVAPLPPNSIVLPQSGEQEQGQLAHADNFRNDGNIRLADRSGGDGKRQEIGKLEPPKISISAPVTDLDSADPASVQETLMALLASNTSRSSQSTATAALGSRSTANANAAAPSTAANSVFLVVGTSSAAAAISQQLSENRPLANADNRAVNNAPAEKAGVEVTLHNGIEAPGAAPTGQMERARETVSEVNGRGAVAASAAVAPASAARPSFQFAGGRMDQSVTAANPATFSSAASDAASASGIGGGGGGGFAGGRRDTGGTVSGAIVATPPPQVVRLAEAANSFKDKEAPAQDAQEMVVTKSLRDRLTAQPPKTEPASPATQQPPAAVVTLAFRTLGQLNDAPTPRPAQPAPVPQPEVQTRDNAFTTFSLNVSDVAFKLAAASLQNGAMPEAASMRSEEFINAFDYRDPEPAPGAPIGFAWERAGDPFAHNRDLLRFSIRTAAQGREAGRRLNLVLLLDKSGSMERADRVEIIAQALNVLASQLQPRDTLSVVVFARTARLWVDGVPGDKAGGVATDLRGLTPEGGTNLEEAMRLAYETALRHYLADGENRVVLLTDGAANLGNVEPEALKQKVEANRKQGISLDCFGVGWDGYNDDLLETLSRAGNGRYGFINTPEEAATEFAGKLAGALRVAAADVKVQVEFNPNRVTAYRQIGYAKYQLTKEQFRDNSVTAAQIGAAESGNGLYTVEINPAGDGPLCTVHVRFRVPGTSDYQEHEWTVPYTGTAVALDQASSAMRLAATAAAFSEWLAASPYAADVTPDRLLVYLSGVPQTYGADARPARLEWMIRQAKSISGK